MSDRQRVRLAGHAARKESPALARFAAFCRRSSLKRFAGIALFLLIFLALSVVEPFAGADAGWVPVARVGALLGSILLLGSLAWQYQRLQRDLVCLAAWPTDEGHDGAASVAELLRHVGRVLRASRVVLVREDESGVLVDTWSERRSESHRAPGAGPEALLAPVLGGATFVCDRLDQPECRVIFRSPAGVQRWRGEGAAEPLRTWISGGPVLSAPLSSSSVRGRIFALHGHFGRGERVLLLAQAVAEALCARLHERHHAHGLRQKAIVEERGRFSRDLHDGLLQSMTAWSLRLADIAQRIEQTDSHAAVKLAEMRQQISSTQRELRMSIGRLRLGSSEPVDFSLIGRLHDLRDRFADQWGLTVTMDFSGLHALIPPPLRAEICRLLHEGLANAARHAQTSLVSVVVAATDRHVSVVLQDRGAGFPFHGRFDLAALRAQGRGPVSLMERVEALGGNLTLDSSPCGSCLSITVPLEVPTLGRNEHAS